MGSQPPFVGSSGSEPLLKAPNSSVGPPQEAEKVPAALAVDGADVSKEKARAEHAKYLARYLNTNALRKGSNKLVAVAVVTENGKFNRAISSALVTRFGSTAVEVLSSLFKPEFISDGVFANLFEGSRDAVAKLELAEYADGVLLARQEVVYTTDPSLENVVSAHMILEMQNIPLREATAGNTWRFAADGVGFKELEARLLAEERLIKQITNDTTMALAW